MHYTTYIDSQLYYITLHYAIFPFLILTLGAWSYLYNIYCCSVYTVLFQTMSILKASTYCSITVMGYCLWNHKCTPGVVYSHSLCWKYVCITIIHNPAFW